MKRLRVSVTIVAIMVFLICLYTFFLGNKTFDGEFDNDGISFYFLAKGMFCSLALYLLVRILEAVRENRNQ